MLLPSVLVAGAELVTTRSARLTTVPLTVAELLAELGSGVLLLTEAVSLKAAPSARVSGAETTRVKVSTWPEATAAVAVSVTLLPDWAKVKPSGLPAAGVSDTKTEPAGRVSLRTTPWASEGPLLVRVIV